MSSVFVSIESSLMCSVGSRKNVYEERLALAMAFHPRLGQMSPLAHLELEHLVKCAPEIPMYDPDSDPARDDPNPEDNIFWELDEDQLFVFRTGGTWADVFSAKGGI